MWLDKFKEIIKLRGYKMDDMAEVAEMSRTGFRQGFSGGTLRFDVMVKLMKYYDINYYELTEDTIGLVNEKTSLYENSKKKHHEINIILENLRKTYEDRIKKCEEYNEHLKGQVLFMQQIISKNIGLGETTSHTG
jgi:hypothetical protein